MLARSRPPEIAPTFAVNKDWPGYREAPAALIESVPDGLSPCV